MEHRVDIHGNAGWTVARRDELVGRVEDNGFVTEACPLPRAALRLRRILADPLHGAHHRKAEGIIQAALLD